MKTFEELFGIDTCYSHIKHEVEVMKYDPIRLLGKYILRDKQDALFNSTMIDAMLKYIEDNNIKWNDK